MAVDWDYEDALANDLADSINKLDAASDVKEALVLIGQAQLNLMYVLYLETRRTNDLSKLHLSAIAGVERSMSEILTELREIRDGLDAQRT